MKTSTWFDLVFLLDENVPHDVVGELKRLRAKTLFSRDELGEQAPDHEVIAHARTHKMAVVTANVKHFEQAKTKCHGFLFLVGLGETPAVQALRRFRDVLKAARAAPLFRVNVGPDWIKVTRSNEPVSDAPIEPVHEKKKRKRRGKPRARKASKQVDFFKQLE